ncbi:PAS domain-containing protein [Azospirillum sp. A29]|uniref:PAS domain-containing protein n=1 Tax=Azospirillum sp. A29 TaxID=3160606 RepID=UPI00366E9AFC
MMRLGTTAGSAFDTLTDNAPIGFAFFDRDHRYTKVNAALAKINGISADAHVGRTIEELLPEYARTVGPIIDQVFTTGDAVAGFEMDGETPASQGAQRTWLLGFFPVPGEDGAVAQVGATVVEITDRKRAEAELRQSEERLRLATEHAEIGLWDVDEVNQQLHWPPIVKAMFGISADVPVSMRDYYEGLHPDDHDATAAAYAAAADPNRRSLYDVEYRTIGKEDGIVRWVAAKGRGVFDEAGRCLRVIGTAMDITERKRVEAELRELNQALEHRIAEALTGRKVLADVVDGTDIFVQVADVDYNWLAINRAASAEFARIFGVRKPRVGDNMLALLERQPEHQAAVRAVWSRALAGKEFVQTDEFGDPSLDRRYYEMRFRSLRDAEGRLIGAYQFVSDVTERLREQHRLRETEGALAQAQKMEAVGQLTGGIAHDFNNLLQGVVGSLDLIRRKSHDHGRVQRWAEAGLKAAQRGSRLTGQLLAFSRAQKIELKPVSVSDLVSAFREMVASTIGPHIKVSLDLKTDGIRVLGDEVQIEMAVLNLALNARDAMPEGGDLTISTRPVSLAGDRELADGEYVELAVRDTGMGMPPEVVARAFDPFFTTKGVGKGTGLGLSQVYGAMRQAGGTVRIDTRPGEGTTMHLLLRRTDDLAERAADERRVTATGLSARILVVDDDPDVRQFLVESLDELGFAVTQAEDGSAGLTELERSTPDLMILDFAMPGLNGAEVAKRAQASRPGMPIIFVTGFADSEALEEVVGGNIPVLRKPFQIDELERMLLAVLQDRTPAA